MILRKTAVFKIACVCRKSQLESDATIQHSGFLCLQVNSSQWNFSGCTCLPWGHNADGKLREVAESLKQIAQRVKGMQISQQQEDPCSQV